MNLGELLDRTGVELRHDPSSTTERNNRAAILVDEYERLCQQYRWQFLYNIDDDFRLYPDFTLTGTFTFNSRVITSPLTGLPDEYIGAEVTGLPAAVANTRVYIDRISGATWYLSGLTGSVSLTQADSITVTLRRNQLPLDFADMGAIISRADDRGALKQISLPEEAQMMLNDDETASAPVGYVMHPPPELDRPPYFTLTTFEEVAPTDIPQGTYRYFCAYYQQGRLSGRSSIVSITTVGTSNIQLGGWDDWTAAADQRGVELWVYREDDANGVFRRTMVIDTATSTSQSDDNSTVRDDLPWQDHGPYRYVRFWERLPAVTSTDTTTTRDTWQSASRLTFELRYQQRQPRLQHDLDVPRLPHEHHKLLVHLTVERIAAQYDDNSLSKFHGKLAAEQLTQMKRRYLISTATEWQMRQWTSGLGGAHWNRPTITRAP